MDIDETAKEKQGNPVVVVLVGTPRNGKSTFCEHVMRSTRPLVRICQDTIKNGKAVTKGQCIESAMNALTDGESVFIGKESKEGEELVVGSVGGDGSPNDASTLAFPSISTADFQFDLAKASDIIVEKVTEFGNKLGNFRLVLVESEKSIDSNKFLTFMGDITRIHSFRRFTLLYNS
ncbi:hypothetical protein ACFX10_009935 [Malus domestica]